MVIQIQIVKWLRIHIAAAGIVLALVAGAYADGPVRVVPQNQQQLLLSYAPVVKAVAPAVVNIYTKKVIKVRQQGSPFFNDPFFRQFFGDHFSGGGQPQDRIQQALGSGVLVTADGVIVTSNHVIDGADQITVALSDRREFEAKVVLADKSTDLAVLRIDTRGEKLPFLAFQDSDRLQVGDVVLAIGDPFGVGQTVTSGIVSALARTNVGVSDYQFFIQTDAAINPGNSGGALVTLDGKLAGINTAIYSRSGGSIGIGFAIPSNMVSSVMTAALGDGKIIQPWFGASGQVVTADIAEVMGLKRPVGVLINQLYPGGPADKAGIKAGDIVLSVGGHDVYDIEGLRFRLRLGNGKKDNKVPMELLRDGKRITVKMELSPAPEIPARNITTITSKNFFQGVKVGNMSPAFAEELHMDTFEKGVVVLGIDQRSLPGQYGLLRPRDVIIQVNNHKIETVADLKSALKEDRRSPDYRLHRDGSLIECGQNADGSFGCRQ